MAVGVGLDGQADQGPGPNPPPDGGNIPAEPVKMYQRPGCPHRTLWRIPGRGSTETGIFHRITVLLKRRRRRRIMNRTVFAAAFIAVLGGCAGGAGEKSGEVPRYEEKAEAYTVVDHKTKALGEEIPEWLSRYINGGLSDIENMGEYKDKYVFIGEDSGSSLNALRQWSAGFSVAQDFSRLVSSRVQARFAGAAAGSPEESYGRYFEDAVKTSSDASYTGAQRESDFWLLRRYFEEDGKTVKREVYDFYVLISIDRPLLERRLKEILEGIRPEPRPARDQAAAVERIRENFFEEF
jgi:hypothetical protein